MTSDLPVLEQIEAQILAASRRRAVNVLTEAALHKISKKHAQQIIRKLVRQGKIYNCNRARPNFWGSISGEYRAV